MKNKEVNLRHAEYEMSINTQVEMNTHGILYICGAQEKLGWIFEQITVQAMGRYSACRMTGSSGEEEGKTIRGSTRVIRAEKMFQGRDDQQCQMLSRFIGSVGTGWSLVALLRAVLVARESVNVRSGKAETNIDECQSLLEGDVGM